MPSIRSIIRLFRHKVSACYDLHAKLEIVHCFPNYESELTCALSYCHIITRLFAISVSWSPCILPCVRISTSSALELIGIWFEGWFFRFRRLQSHFKITVSFPPVYSLLKYHRLLSGFFLRLSVCVRPLGSSRFHVISQLTVYVIEADYTKWCRRWVVYVRTFGLQITLYDESYRWCFAYFTWWRSSWTRCRIRRWFVSSIIIH